MSFSVSRIGSLSIGVCGIQGPPERLSPPHTIVLLQALIQCPSFTGGGKGHLHGFKTFIYLEDLLYKLFLSSADSYFQLFRDKLLSKSLNKCLKIRIFKCHIS